MPYKTKHVILTPVKQHDLGAHVDAGDLGDQAEVDRLLKIGAIEPLEGYTAPEPRPDQGSDPTPRGAVAPDWFSGARTPEEIDAEIAALQAQRESAVQTQKRQEETAVDNAATATTSAPQRSTPRKSGTEQAV